jgi:carotenoid cleavage dioxygenase
VLDPNSLDTHGKKVWRDDLKGLPFTAHPKVEPDGTLWSFGYDVLSGRIIIYHIGKDGVVRQVGVIAAAPFGMLHDAAVTTKHVVFALAPFVIDRERFSPTTSFLDAHVWRPELGMRVLAVAKDDLKTTRTWQLPVGFSFHFGNAWEEADGTIRFDYCLASDASLLTETFRYIMRGEFRGATGPTHFARVTLRPGQADGEQEVVDTASEFPRVAPTVVGRRYRYVYTVDSPSAEGFTGVMRWDLEGGGTQRFDYGASFLAEEHVFVPRPRAVAEDDGWLIGTALDLDHGVTTLNVFDAARIADGPLARGSLPYPLPLGFHGQFVPA